MIHILITEAAFAAMGGTDVARDAGGRFMHDE
jgi:hypothetical protein